MEDGDKVITDRWPLFNLSVTFDELHGLLRFSDTLVHTGGLLECLEINSAVWIKSTYDCQGDIIHFMYMALSFSNTTCVFIKRKTYRDKAVLDRHQPT